MLLSQDVLEDSSRKLREQMKDLDMVGWYMYFRCKILFLKRFIFYFSCDKRITDKLLACAFIEG